MDCLRPQSIPENRIMETKRDDNGILTRIAWGLCGLFVAFSYPIAAFVLSWIPALEGLDSTARRLIFSGAWIFLAAAVAVILYFAKSEKPLLSFRIIEIKDKKQAWLLPLVSVIGFLGGVALNRIVNVCHSLIQFPASWENQYSETIEGTVQGNPIVAFFALCAAAPLIEELSFRGKAFYYFRKAVGKRAGTVVAVAVTSLLFASLHGNPIQFIYALICGVAFSLLTVSCGSVIPSVFAHVGFNAANLIFYVFLNNQNRDNMQLMVNIASFVVFAFCVAAAVITGRILRHRKEDRKENSGDIYIE